MIVLIDNYDSFVHTLARYFVELGETVRVLRNDAIDAAGLGALQPEAVVLSPGPCGPAEAGACVPIVKALAGRIPMLGVCLGHQCIGAAFGARIARARQPLHGEASAIEHRGSGLFHGLPNPLRAGRYHSLIVEEPVAGPLVATAWSTAGEIMALEHRMHPVFGVQFHPESVLTEAGHDLLANFLRLARARR